MITNRSLRFALCALLLLAPLATLAAQEMDEMQDDEGFYISAAYGATMPGDRDISDEATTISVGTEFGLLGGRFGVGYGVGGFRPEVSVGYRSATVDSVAVTKSDLLPPAALRLANSALADVSGTVSSIDLAANLYYDIGSGSAFSLYLGVGGGLSLVTVKLDPVAGFPVAPYSDSASALSVQAAAGIGYAIMEDLTLTLGYRLVGTMEANFSKYSTTKAKTGMTLSHTIEAGLRFSF